MLRMDKVYLIRHKVRVEGKSIRQVARELGLSRPTVKKYLAISEPKRVESDPRPTPVKDQVAPRIDHLLDEWRTRTTPKQRITGTRLHRQLREEGYEVGITTVREYLHEARRRSQEVFIPLIYRRGEVAQVDFFDVTIEEAGQLRKAWKFLMHLMYSSYEFVWLYDRCDQLSFLDAHVRAFSFFGGVPQRLAYDNLSAAVQRIIGPERELTQRFTALVSHYLFEPGFARPGEGRGPRAASRAVGKPSASNISHPSRVVKACVRFPINCWLISNANTPRRRTRMEKVFSSVSPRNAIPYDHYPPCPSMCAARC